MTDGCGPPPWTQCAVFGPDGSCGRTRVLYLDLGMENPSDGFSSRWPKWGTWGATGAFVLPKSERVTDEIGCLSLLPTPTVGDSKSARNSTAKRHVLPPTGIHAGDTLTDAVTLLPTPTARDWKVGAPCEAVEENALLGRVAWSIGATTPPPSPGMNDSSDDPPRLPLTTGDV